MTVICKCGEPARPGQRTCRVCHARYMRDFRNLHGSTEQQRFRNNARSYLHVYVRRGKVQRKPCEMCGQPAEAHHYDYSKPLDVRWLCRKHHLQFHTVEKLLMDHLGIECST